MKHTKGKWECSEVMNFSDELVSYITSGELSIAQTRGSTPQGRTVEEITANAKLIAATPELLEMLIKISNIENHAFTLKGFDVKRLKSEINEVIKKTK